ncbi:Hint domain-containing protein [Pacificibacter maritimus]|nr:Hint domain-containing protein [Pacificibacter maritimus]
MHTDLPDLENSLTLNSGAVPTQNLPVYLAEDFRVINGANFGDPISHADEIELDDTYQLENNAERARLAINVHDNAITIAEGSDLGVVGADVHLDCVVTLMAPDGATVEVLILVETDDRGMIEATYMLPLAPLLEKQDYSAVTLDRENARTRLAEVACVSFTRRTLITMANGLQKPIEQLNVGDRVLTRDHGPREVRWIGHQTVRATGSFAPIIIKKGALNNENDLTVSPNHRIFIYQRKDRLRADRAEVLVKAKLLVNGVNVVQSDGGFVEYYQLLFDNHEIIYAEGIAAESMFVDTQVKPYLPADVQARLSSSVEFHEPTRGFELSEMLIEPEDAAKLLRSVATS